MDTINGRRIIAKDFFVYQLDFPEIVAGATLTGNINIQADSAFLLQKMNYLADISGAAQTDATRVIPLISVQLTDTGSGRNLLSSSGPLSCIFGEGDSPGILTSPKEFSPKATISIVINNFSAATDYNVKLSFIGQKLFYG